ncbi:MAG: GNAT family N-acetyltransferase [Chloroflexi bacterium]|nr:GNAT family N-acetyltransferase [Chloroflexota bacterium]
MNVDYRPLQSEDIEQAAHLEAVAFYGKPTPERVEMTRRFFPPEWTVAAFVDGRLVADARTIPGARRINGGSIPFGRVGPVACLAEYRRQGHVGRLLRLSLERMRDQGQAMSGLHTPHDSLYTRYGWERAEGRKRYEFRPKDIALRFQGAPGRLESVIPDDWQRLDRIFREWAGPRNGPLHRVEPWWREAVLRHYEDSGERTDSEALVWVDPSGQDGGYIVYLHQLLPREGTFPGHLINVRDFVALNGDAYLGLWRHLLTHDLASLVVVEVAPDDPFPDLVQDPWKVQISRGQGAMLRIVDVERAIAMRPYCGDGSIDFTMRIADGTAPWNEGAWRVEALEGRMRAERTDAAPDVELTANALAPIFTGHLRPDVAAGVGLLTVSRDEAIEEMAAAFAVTYPPYCNDWY